MYHKLARQSQTGGSDKLVRDRFNADWSYESVFHKTMSLVRDRFNADWSYESVFHKTMSMRKISLYAMNLFRSCCLVAIHSLDAVIILCVCVCVCVCVCACVCDGWKW